MKYRNLFLLHESKFNIPEGEEQEETTCWMLHTICVLKKRFYLCVYLFLYASEYSAQSLGQGDFSHNLEN